MSAGASGVPRASGGALRGLADPWFLGVLALVLAATELPYVAAERAVGAGAMFAGHFAYDGDIHMILSFVRQAREGAWLFENRFTPEPHEPALFNLAWLLFGRLAALLDLGPNAALRVARVLGAVVLCGAFWTVAGAMLRTHAWRRVAFAAFATGGGFGWAFVLANAAAARLADGGAALPVLAADLRGGFHPFWQILNSGHLSLAHGLLLATVGVLAAAVRDRSRGKLAAATVGGVLVGLVRPVDLRVFLAVAASTATVVTVRDRRRGRPVPWRLWWPAAAALLPLAQHAVLFGTHPVFRWWRLQNTVVPPGPAELVAAVGLAGVIALVALVTTAVRLPEDDARVPLWSYVAVACAAPLAYPLVSFAGQILDPLAGAALLGAVAWLEGRTRGAWSRAGTAAAVGLLVLNAASSAWLVRDALDPGKLRARTIEADDAEVLGWHGAHAPTDAVVLTPPRLRARVAGRTHCREYCGYHFATVDFATKAAFVRATYAAAADGTPVLEAVRSEGVELVVLPAAAPGAPSAPVVFENAAWRVIDLRDR